MAKLQVITPSPVPQVDGGTDEGIMVAFSDHDHMLVNNMQHISSEDIGLSFNDRKQECSAGSYRKRTVCDACKRAPKLDDPVQHCRLCKEIYCIPCLTIEVHDPHWDDLDAPMKYRTFLSQHQIDSDDNG